MQICRGLSLEDAATLGMVLLGADAAALECIPGAVGTRCRQALTRVPVENTAMVGRAIVERLAHAHHEGALGLDPSWVEVWSEQERSRCIELATGSDLGRPEVPRWVQETLVSAHPHIGLDPRHRWELTDGFSLEIEQVRLLDGAAVGALIRRVGLSLLLVTLGANDRRHALLFARGLGPPLAEVVVEMLRETPAWGPRAVAIATKVDSRAVEKASSNMERIEELGRLVMIWAGVGGSLEPNRHREVSAGRGANSELGRAAVERILADLQALSRQGLVAPRLATLWPTVGPPTTALPDEVEA